MNEIDTLADALVGRIQERARDPGRRNDLPPTLYGKTVAVGPFAISGLDLGALVAGDPDPRPAPEPPLAAPASPESVARAEEKLGFALPPGLRRLYAEVADGGVGPGAGLLAIEQVTEVYLGLVATAPGPRGQTWPRELLPITWTDPGHECVDVATGRIVFWDEEELADGGSDKVWKRSFKPEAPDLATWLERWLDRPSPEDELKARMQDAMLVGIRQSLDHWRAMTVAEREEFGLPETGWEEVLFGHLGLDLSQL